MHSFHNCCLPRFAFLPSAFIHFFNMLDLTNATLQGIAVHRIGNKLNEGELICSKKELKLKDDLKSLVSGWFLNAFRSPVWFHFNPDNIKPAGIQAASEIFANREKLLFQSVNLAKHLFECTAHPKIKEGELYVCYFTGGMLDEEELDFIGIFKSESKDTYLKVGVEESVFQLTAEEGINIHKLDKGCLVFNTEADVGYRLCIVDTVSSGEEARYWKYEFLDIKPRNDSYFKTNSLINLTRDFCKDILVEENNVSPLDRMAVMNDSVRYMEKNSSFSMEQFEQEVLQEPTVIEAFQDYKRNYQSLKENNYELTDIEVAPEAMKKNSKFFKHAVKLDKNFHLYIHGNPQMMERGYDEEKGMKYYKLFYTNETYPE